VETPTGSEIAKKQTIWSAVLSAANPNPLRERGFPELTYV
jgi:hypothetical protein